MITSGEFEAMNKKYRLRIPDMIRKEDAGIAEQCKGVEECIEVKVTCRNPESHKVVQIRRMTCHVPSEWLEEIKDGPVSAEEWFAMQYPDNEIEDCFDCDGGDIISIFSAGGENHAKRVQPVIDILDSLIKRHESEPSIILFGLVDSTEVRQAIKDLKEINSYEH